MTSKKKKYIAVGVVAVIVLCIGWFAKSQITYRLGNAVKQSAVIFIPTGASEPAFADSIKVSGAIKNTSEFERFARSKDMFEKFKPGRYELKKGMTYAQVINRFIGGMQSPVRVTFNNVRTLDRFAAVIAGYLEPDSATMCRYLSADSVSTKFGLSPQTMISLFIPNTYEFYWTTSPEKFVERMKNEYDKFWNEERISKAKEVNMSQTEVYTLASIVYEETKMSDEMPKVAGVYINRLKIGMPLQADPTVKFAVGDFSIRRVLNRHLEVDSPYNTYKNTGLPPGPICMPSIRAIDAVLHYAKHNYLYFCASPDFSGYHVFAASLADHNKNAQEYARALNRNKIFK